MVYCPGDGKESDMTEQLTHRWRKKKRSEMKEEKSKSMGNKMVVKVD